MSGLRAEFSSVVRAWRARLLGPRSAVYRQGIPNSPRRILFVANAMIPTLQLSFLKPLAAAIEKGEVAAELLSEQQLKERFGRHLRQPAVRAWVAKRFARARPTVVVFCRYSGPAAEELIALARAAGIPTVLHIDDDLLNVPPEIGAKKFAFHNHPARQASVRHLLAHVDLIYCSTAGLKQRLLSLGFDRHYFVGDIYCAGAVLAEPVAGSVTRIGYMGYDHAHDFALAVPALVDVMRACPALTFEIFGPIPVPPALEEFGARICRIPPVADYASFLAALASRRWAVGICPLAATPFNAVKANTKWVEYTSVGAAVIASRNTIYDACCAQERGLLVDGHAAWRDALLALIADESRRLTLVRNAQALLRDQYSIDSLRAQVLRALATAEIAPRADATHPAKS